MARPFWSGQIQISLVSFGVDLFPATETKSAIRFHQLSRKTGQRVKHQKVSGEEGPVENSDIVKGYEVSKGQYVAIEPSEIENLRIPSRRTIEVTQFVDSGELDPELFEKPYFVVPENESQAGAFAVVRKALEATRKVALGKIAFSGREHLVALASTGDDKLPGMMAYTLRYAEELRNPADYFGNIKKVSIEDDQLSLAKELIKRKTAKFNAEKFTDEYEAALRELVEAKVQHAPIPELASAPKAQVVNLMDALRKSIQEGQEASKKKGPGKVSAAESKKGMALVKTAKNRKSA
jgi:DNA end-binding protein Ku